MLLEGWTVGLVASSFPAKKLAIFTKLINTHGGHLRHIEECNQDALERFPSEPKHVILIDAAPGQDVKALFKKCPNHLNLAALSFVSANWLSDSIKTGELKDQGPYEVHHSPHPPKMARSEPETKVSLLDPSFSNHPYDCFRPAPLDHKNRGLIAELAKIAHHRYLIGDARSELSYNRAIAILKTYPKDIESADEAEQLQGIGPKITGLVGEYLRKGLIEAAAILEGNQELQVLDSLTKIHGVGPKTAQSWYRMGIHSVDELRESAESGAVSLQDDQKAGIKFYDDFLKPISRAEVEEIFDIVSSACKRLFHDTVVAEMTGGYRRGKEMSGDADILIHPIGFTPSKSEIMDRLIHELRGKHIKEIMSLSKSGTGKSKDKKGLDFCFMAFQVAPGRIMRRVDFIVSTRETYAFAMLGWTGSRQFERSIRLYAHREHGLTLTDHSLTSANGETFDFVEEKQIFECLGVPFLEPSNRNL